MKNDRRNFLRIASFSAGAVTILPRGFALTPQHTAAAAANATALIGLSAASFRPWIGSRFGLVDYSGAHLVLAAVDEQTHPAPARVSGVVGQQARGSDTNYTISFSLRFQIIGMATKFKQDTYLLSHNGLGRFPLFLVPSDGRASATCSAQFSAPPARGLASGPLPVQLPRVTKFSYREN